MSKKKGKSFKADYGPSSAYQAPIISEGIRPNSSRLWRSIYYYSGKKDTKTEALLMFIHFPGIQSGTS